MRTAAMWARGITIATSWRMLRNLGAIAVVGIAAQESMLRRRDFRISAATVAARPFELRRLRLPAEIALWTLIGLVLVLPLCALVLTSLVPAVGVTLGAKTATLDNFRFVMFEHAAARRAFVNSFALSTTAAIVIAAIAIPLAYFVVWRRSRLLRVVNLVTEIPYAVPGVVLAPTTSEPRFSPSSSAMACRPAASVATTRVA